MIIALWFSHNSNFPDGAYDGGESFLHPKQLNTLRVVQYDKPICFGNRHLPKSVAISKASNVE
jgi:hypothetical protein